MNPDTSEKSTRADLDRPFLEPIPEGCIPMGLDDEMVCDHDHYNTGDEDRARGCGGIYYQRSYVTPNGWAVIERTPCKCMLAIMQQRENDRQLKEIQDRREYISRLAANYFGDYDMMRDDAYNRYSLQNYKPGNQSQIEALDKLQNFTVGRESICLQGPAGRGKTHLALGVARDAREKGSSVLALKTIDLLTRIKRTYDKKDDAAEAAIMRVLKNIDLLVIDDIGVEKTTEWVLAKLYEVIDYRHGRKSTIFTTNLTGQQMKAKEGQALVSRILGAEVSLEIEGKDYRIA